MQPPPLPPISGMTSFFLKASPASPTQSYNPGIPYKDNLMWWWENFKKNDVIPDIGGKGGGCILV